MSLKAIDQKIRLALQYCQEGNLHQAEDVCREILKKQPDNVLVLNFLGVIQYQLGNFENATELLTKALRCSPSSADIYYNLGNISKDSGLAEEAIAHYRKAIGLNPNLFEAYHNLGLVYQEQNNLNEAEECYQKALQLNPGIPDTYYNLGTIFQDRGLTDEAVAQYQEAIRRDPKFTDAHYNLANIFRDQKIHEKAVTHYRQALQLNPNMFDALYNLGTLYQAKEQYDDALDSYEQALRINPNLPEAYNSMGIILQQKDDIDGALEHYRRAVDLRPDFVEAMVNTGNALRDYRHSGEAEHWYRNALAFKPDCAYCYDNLFFLMLYHSRYDPHTTFFEHKQFAVNCAEMLLPFRSPFYHEKSSDRRLKIGYVSPDFRRHSVAFFIEPVLAGHNREQVEVYCYSDVPREDGVTGRIKGYADHWQDIAGMPDEQVAEKIRSDGIDILIDLAGHTAHNRLLVFARKPAPLQVTWLGYPATTGLSVMDYKIVDEYTDPPGKTEHFYTEKLLRMPAGFLCYLPDRESPAVGPLPALSNGYVTFGSSNNFAKVTPEVMDLWARILEMLPASRLVIKAKSLSDRPTRTAVLERFTEKGIKPERLELLGWEPSSQAHLDLYNRIDIALDTFPYNGTTTTCEALWMGVPAITLAGRTHASRVGASLLANAGIPGLVAESPEEYLTLAFNLAGDIRSLASLRGKLRDSLSRSALTDSTRFAAELERSYRSIWQEWCRSEKHHA
ncbi:MAG: tetratricopeptide repeat protein [Nitrospirota bacterium]